METAAWALSRPWEEAVTMAMGAHSRRIIGAILS